MPEYTHKVYSKGWVAFRLSNGGVVRIAEASEIDEMPEEDRKEARRIFNAFKQQSERVSKILKRSMKETK